MHYIKRNAQEQKGRLPKPPKNSKRNKTMKNCFTYNCFGTNYENCKIATARYNNTQNLALLLNDEEGEGITTLTTNLKKLPEGMVCIKNWSENQGVEDFLINAGIVRKYPVCHIQSGFVAAPVYALTEEGKELVKELEKETA